MVEIYRKMTLKMFNAEPVDLFLKALLVEEEYLMRIFHSSITIMVHSIVIETVLHR